MPNAQHYKLFEFSETEILGRTLFLRYKLSKGTDQDILFEEQLVLPDEVPPPDPADPIVNALIDGIHRVFGVSYFKAAVPPDIAAQPVSGPDAAFWDNLYTEGLGEFWYRNQLDPGGRVHFPANGDQQVHACPKPARERVLVLVGGGKDSAVASEIVRHAGVQADALSLGNSFWQKRSASVMGLRHLVIKRSIDHKLIELNQRGALNGHVPVSACIAFISILVAYLGGYSAVIVANEHSAEEGNLEWNGLSINHQWSKSLHFEAGFQNWIERRLSGGPTYFSILRTLGELRISELFARHPKHFDAFASCNANFKLSKQDKPDRWCGHCPKCVFVQLMLAPHLDSKTLDSIFNADFLSDNENLEILEELTGIKGTKPFECVGTTEECRAALARLAGSGRLAPDLKAWFDIHVSPLIDDPEKAWDRAHEASKQHRIPPSWVERLNAYL